MQTLKTDVKVKAITSGGKKDHMKEIVCEECGTHLRFLLALPRICPYCWVIISFPDSLYADINDRLEYYAKEQQ